jgi:3-hydroxyisobutyrate dehydrogenase-like beta-hydroxyacid dehydrogenase
MGKGIARNAAAAELEVHAWNRTAAKLEDLADTSGVETFATAREAVADVDVVVTMLSDADATIGLEGSERCAALARDRGLI